MNQEQEYVKFWLSIKNKCDEVQEDYSKLSDDSKCRVDNTMREIFRANTYFDVLNIIHSQAHR